MPNPYEQSKRAEKAMALMGAITKVWEALSPAQREGRSLAVIVENFGDAEWKHYAIVAGVNEPSEKTRAVVVNALHTREATPDPFAGIAA